MIEQGGSSTQKFNTLTNEWVPDRSLLPYVLQPDLEVTDPDHTIIDGNHTADMTNVKWTAEIFRNNEWAPMTVGTDYSVDSATKSIKINRNLETSEIGHVLFYGEYLDRRRMEVHKFTWEKFLNIVAETEYNLVLRVDKDSKTDLYPLKDLGEFPIQTQLMNADLAMPDNTTTYHWQWYDETDKTWQDITGDELWYSEGKDTKNIVIRQLYIQHLYLKETAYPNEVPQKSLTKFFLFRRWYGQWWPDVEFESGKYIFADTTEAKIAATITNRSGGNIPNPQKYFDIRLYYRGSDKWNCVGEGTEATVTRQQMVQEKHVIGICARELSAFLPLADQNGHILTMPDNGVIAAQLPTSEIEED
jgi:hypothetical protein